MEDKSLSPILSLNWKDVLNSLVLGVITSVLTALVPILNSGTIPTFDNLKTILVVGLTTSIANVIRKYLTNSSNTFALPEKKD